MPEGQEGVFCVNPYSQSYFRKVSLNSGVQFPESFNADADPMLRIAQRKGIVNAEELKNIQKGHKLQAAEGAKEADAAGATLHTAREETIQAAAESMAENRNVLAERMTKAERQKMESLHS